MRKGWKWLSGLLLFAVPLMLITGCGMPGLRRDQSVKDVQHAIERIQTCRSSYRIDASGDDPAPRARKRYLRYYGLDGIGETHQLIYVPVQDEYIATQIWSPAGPSRGSVLLLHGYLQHTGIMAPLIRFLVKRNWKVVALDLQGHGLSTGPGGNIDSFDTYNTALNQVYRRVQHLLDSPHVFMGHSMGGAVLINEALRRTSIRMNELVLLAPLVRPTYWGISTTFYPLADLFAESIPRPTKSVTHDEDVMDFLNNRDPLQGRRIPFGWVNALEAWTRKIQQTDANDHTHVHVLQGTGDSVVSWKDNLTFLRRKFSKIHVRKIENARHLLFQESETYRKEMFQQLRYFY